MGAMFDEGLSACRARPFGRLVLPLQPGEGGLLPQHLPAFLQAGGQEASGVAWLWSSLGGSPNADLRAEGGNGGLSLPRVVQNTGCCKGRVRGWGGTWTPTELTRSSSPGGRWIIGGQAGLSMGSYSRGSSPVRKEPAQPHCSCTRCGPEAWPWPLSEPRYVRPHSCFGISSQFLPCLPVLRR